MNMEEPPDPTSERHARDEWKRAERTIDECRDGMRKSRWHPLPVHGDQLTRRTNDAVMILPSRWNCPQTL